MARPTKLNFTHGASRVRSQELQGSGIRSGSGNNDGVLHGIRVGQTLNNLGHSRSFLTNGDVDTVQLLLLIGTIVETLLVNDGINGNGSFTVK